jgi:hypothetical protein
MQQAARVSDRTGFFWLGELVVSLTFLLAPEKQSQRTAHGEWGKSSSNMHIITELRIGDHAAGIIVRATNLD